jgi:hypothetical protein
LSSPKLSAGNGATGVGVATGIIAASLTAASLNGRSDTTRDRTPPATGSSFDLGLVRSNGEGSYGGLLPFMRFSSRQ